MKIALLGATSEIAKDLILSLSNNANLSLFCRDSELLSRWMISNSLVGKYQIKTFDEFYQDNNFDVIINFVGVGDPAKAKKIGRNIIEITDYYDDMALKYLENNIKLS